MTTLFCALALALAQAAPPDRPPAADTSQRGSRGGTAGGAERTGPPAAGIESGDANGLAGGRTDEGPAGGTGIRRGAGRSERQKAKADDQARGRNAKGSLARPADSPAQINRKPKAMGSGVPNLPPEQEPRAQGKNYGRRRMEGNAGGAASGEDNPGGSSPAGVSGKSKRTQPGEHQAEQPQPEPK